MTLLPERARARAARAEAALAAGEPLGPLQGVPIAIKDLVDSLAGVRNTFGCRVFADFVPEETATYVERLEAAGQPVVHLCITDTANLGQEFFRWEVATAVAGIPALGICLGAQLLAEQFGAKVQTGDHKEIGWFDVQLEPRARTTWLGNALPNRFQSFFWHGDFFDLPGGAEPVASSEAHHVQGFVLGNCLGLQFHLEATPTWTRRLVKRDAHELVAGRFIQSAERICAATPQCYSENHRLLDRVMDRWLALDQKMKVRRPASSVIS